VSLHTAILEGADVLMASASLGPCPFDRLNNGDPVGSSVVEALVKRVRFLEKVAEERAKTLGGLILSPSEDGLCRLCGR
jgi:hypothetical protein